MSLRLIDRLQAGAFEFNLSVAQHVYYSLERAAGHRLLRRSPPDVGRPALLNLGCGPHIFEGWVNADDYAPKRRMREAAFKPNWALDITRPWKCPDNHWDGVFTEHVLEHVSYSEAVHVLRESLRTMKPGAWLRISVPDLGKYAAFYQSGGQNPSLGDFPHPAVAMSFLTQMHMHRSAWDADLFTRVLTELGFADAREAEFGRGADRRLLRDDPDKKHESLYVEAQKPAL
jgi:predicted SAM-dependent methyltransferase